MIYTNIIVRQTPNGRANGGFRPGELERGNFLNRINRRKKKLYYKIR